MTIKKNIVASILFILTFQIVWSQKKDDNIGTEIVNVVKNYTPTIYDAFKVKDIPTLEDDENTKKEAIQYSIFSFPVASTFNPTKGTVSELEKDKKEKLFSNFANLGIGNYGTINGALFVSQNISKTDYIAGMLQHFSAFGNVKNTDLKSTFATNALDLTYGSQDKNLTWNTDLGFEHQTYNWYGIPTNYSQILYPTDLNIIDPKQSYKNIYLGENATFKGTILKEISTKFNHFWDGYGSSENRFYAKPSFDFSILDQTIKSKALIDYVGGSFEKDYFNSSLISMKYSFVNLGFNPNYTFSKNDSSVNLGLSFYLSADNQNSKNKFFIYPKISANYKVVGDFMIAFAGTDGGLKQNTYQDFIAQNYFVSPTLGVAPTDKKYELYFGLKGKLASYMSYTVKGSYLNENNKALFKSNDYSSLNSNLSGYAFGNSMNVVYDDLKTINFYGELKADFSKTVTFGINGNFSSYKTDVQEKAWNLPGIKIASTLDFNISSKWTAGSSLFFVGTRNDQQFYTTISSATPDFNATLDSYFDLNGYVNYKYSNRWSAFLKANNITNQQYQKWKNYPVQGFQILVGTNYKFDF